MCLFTIVLFAIAYRLCWYLTTLTGTNSWIVFACWCAVKQSMNQSILLWSLWQYTECSLMSVWRSHHTCSSRDAANGWLVARQSRLLCIYLVKWYIITRVTSILLSDMSKRGQFGGNAWGKRNAHSARTCSRYFVCLFISIAYVVPLTARHYGIMSSPYDQRNDQHERPCIFKYIHILLNVRKIKDLHKNKIFINIIIN